MTGEILDYVRTVCTVLGIVPPRIDQGEKLGTGTTLAETEPDGSSIRIASADPSPDLYFALAHELRHVWQIRTNEQKWLAGYQPSSVLDLIAYNMQPAEIDANAFAAIVMHNVFRLRPLFKSMPEDIIKKIYAHADEIARELNKKGD